MAPIPRWGNLQYLGDRPDPVGFTVLVHMVLEYSSLQSIRQVQKSASQLQDFVGLTQILDLTFQGLDMVTLHTGDAIAQSGVGILRPTHEGFGDTADLSCNGLDGG